VANVARAAAPAYDAWLLNYSVAIPGGATDDAAGYNGKNCPLAL
jgi:hypothetical protein